MLYRTRAYMLRQVVTEDGTQYFIDFKDGQVRLSILSKYEQANIYRKRRVNDRDYSQIHYLFNNYYKIDIL